MNLERRLDKLEAAIAEQRHVDPVDLTLLSADELQDLEALAAKAGGDGGAWNLSKLADGELRTLRALVKKARGVTDCH